MSTEARFSVTFKGREAQYKESLWTARGESPEEFATNRVALLDAYEDHYTKVATAQVAEALDATVDVGIAQAVAAAPDQPQPPQAEPCPACSEPRTKWIGPGVSKRTGKPYVGFFACNTPGCKGR